MITITTLWSIMLLAAPAAQAQDCSTWGTINPGTEPDDLLRGEEYLFYVGGGRTCGDVTACEWWLDEDNAIGTLLETNGSPVTYTAPAADGDCTTVSFQIFLMCEDEDPSIDSLSLTVQCSQEDRDNLLSQPGSTVSGGGCTEPSQLGALLPLLWLPFRRRRRDTVEDS